MDINTILRLLKNAGFQVLGTDGSFIHLEDPSCILRSFETFVEYAWIAIIFITGILLFGWAVAYIRGSKIDALFINLRNLTLIFGILAAAKPMVGFIWGGDLFARGCRTISVSIADVQKILDVRNSKLAARNADDLYEEFDIYDSGAIGGDRMPNEVPYSQAPVSSAGSPERIPVTVSGNTKTTEIFTESDVGAPRSARESGNDVIYTGADNREYKRSGGSRAWRNNNPGNIVYSEFARKNGAIGKGGRFAVFPDEATGINATRSLLKSKNYINLTVAGAISRWAPPHENDTAAYHRRLEQLTGIPINTPMKELNDAQLSRVADAIKQIEGWKPGKETKM